MPLEWNSKSYADDNFVELLVVLLSLNICVPGMRIPAGGV